MVDWIWVNGCYIMAGIWLAGAALAAFGWWQTTRPLIDFDSRCDEVEE